MQGTFVEEIDEMEGWDDSRINERKEILAYNLTALVHGETEADKARATAYALFGGSGDNTNMPTTVVPQDALTEGKIGLLDLLLLGNIGKSKSELRRLISQGGIAVNGIRVENMDMHIDKTQLAEGLKIKKGKKVHHKFVI